MNNSLDADTSADRFCSACGSALSASVSFCPQCGKAVTAAAPSGYVQSQNQSTQYYGTPQGTQQGQRYEQPFYQPAAPFPVKNPAKGMSPAKEKNTKKVGLIGFIVLAAITLLLFLLMDVSVIGILTAIIILAALCLIQRKFAVKSWVQSILLLLGGVVLTIIMLFIFTPGGTGGHVLLQTVIKPSSEETVVHGGQYSIVIPGNTVSGDETLTVAKIDELSNAFEDFKPLCPALDVDLGDLKEFDPPLKIEIKYDKNKIGDMNPSEAFIAVFYNEATGEWQDVPYEVDETAGVVRLIMYHLTTVQCYYSLWEGQFVYNNGSVTVLYHMSSYTKDYLAYEKAIGRSTGDKFKPQFVVDVADYATKFAKLYADNGLTVPSHPTIYITAKTNKYRTVHGGILLGVDVIDDKDPEKSMAVNLAHELFHAAQASTIGLLDYSASYYKNAAFWIDATADYMGNTGVWQLMSEKAVEAKEYVNCDIPFFEASLYTADGLHEYQAANFVRYIQGISKATPLQLVTLAESYSAFPNSFTSVYSTNPPFNDLLGYYRAFMEYMLFDGTSNFDNVNNKQTEAAIKNVTSSEFPLDDEGKGIAGSPPVEGSGALTFAGAYSSGFYRFTTNCDTTLTITPSADVMLYVVDRIQTVRSCASSLSAAAGKPTVISFGKDDYIVVAQVSAKSGSLGFTYKLEPKKLDITGKWVMTDFNFTDIEGDDVFFAALQSEFGYSESSLLAEENERTQAELPNLYIMITSTGDGIYTLDLGTANEPITFTDVVLTGNSIQAKTFVNNLWGSITLTIEDETITGTMRAQMRITSGDNSYVGTEVIDFAAAHELITVPE